MMAMSVTEPLLDHDVAVIGGGAAGVMTVIQLLRRAPAGLRVALLEPHAGLGEGIAYATRRPEHLLNVPAGKMSALADMPGDFVDYLRASATFDLPADLLARRYVPRMHFAAYLRDRLARAQAASPARLTVLAAHVDALAPAAGGGFALQLRDRQSLAAGQVVLAVGNALRPLPLRGASSLPESARLEAWDTEAVARVPAGATLCIVGSGLSMVDSAITLARHDHAAPVHVVSRHGLMPLPHAEVAPFEFDPTPLLALRLRPRMRALRGIAATADAQGVPWQAVMERLRPLGQALWQSLDAADQRRFLRHVVRYWDVHRHRIDAGIHAALQAMRQAGQLRLHRARLDAAWPLGACLRVEARGHDGAPLRLDVQRLLNATGVEMRVQAMGNRLLQQLLGDGLAVPGPHGIGIDSDADGRVIDAAGRAWPALHVIGSLRIGRLWESLAIPELRAQAADVAGAVLARRA